MGLGQWNIDAFRWINDLGKHYEWMNPVFFFLAQYMIFLMGLALVVYWFIGSSSGYNRMMVLCAVLSVIVAEAAGKLASLLHHNLQPFAELDQVNQLVVKEVGNSFPSDHTMVCVAIGVTLWLFKGKRGFIWGVIAALVAVSRVGVGVHYPADVLVGSLIAASVAIIVYRFVPRSRGIQRLIGKNENAQKKLPPVRTSS